VRAPRPGSQAGGTVARVPIVLAVAGLLIVGGLVDRAGGGATNAPPSAAAAGEVSVVAPGDALSSSWFCGGATDDQHGEAPGQLMVTNMGPTAIDGTATLVSSIGKKVVEPVHVAAEGDAMIPESVPGGAAWIGAMVDLQGGQATVDQQIVGSLGASSTPCATTGSRSWYFTSGATLVNAGVELSLLNPYPADAIVDLTFTTDQGVEQPGDFQGLVVPARGMLAVDLGSHLRRRQRIATTVSVTTGRVVAWKTDIVTPPAKGQATIGSPQAATAPDPAAPIGGVAVTLGSPSPGTQWTWPEGDSGNGFDEQYAIYNPGSATAEVALTIGLDAGTAEPFDLSVAPDSVSTVVSSSEARVPAGVGHFAEVRSINGVPVVAERTLAVGAPSTISGLGELPGIRMAVPAWLVGANAAPAGTQAYLVIDNPGTRSVAVSVQGVVDGRTAPLATLAPFSVPGGKRASILVNKDAPPSEALVVRASGPVVVERDLYGSGKAPGVSLSPGVPLGS
jgi:hypothetical protein